MDEIRAAFEKWLKATNTNVRDEDLARTHQGFYYSTIPHSALDHEYASVQMLWEAYRASSRNAFTS